MKILTACSECLKHGVVPPEIFTVQVRDDGRYEVHCPKGHVSFNITQAQNFEILYEIGAHAILDGYYREAVSSFMASLERTYEFFLKASFFENNLLEEFSAAWKPISNQSERQLGAFIVSYTSATGKCPPILSSKDTNFRNSVIHKGKIPNRSEAIQFGEIVLGQIRSIISTTRLLYPEGVSKTIFEHLKKIVGPDPTASTGTIAHATIVTLITTDEKTNSRTLEEALSEMLAYHSQLEALPTINIP